MADALSSDHLKTAAQHVGKVRDYLVPRAGWRLSDDAAQPMADLLDLLMEIPIGAPPSEKLVRATGVVDVVSMVADGEHLYFVDGLEDVYRLAAGSSDLQLLQRRNRGLLTGGGLSATHQAVERRQAGRIQRSEDFLRITATLAVARGGFATGLSSENPMEDRSIRMIRSPFAGGRAKAFAKPRKTGEGDLALPCFFQRGRW